MELDNHTAWPATLVPAWSLRGDRQQTLVVKIGYRYDRTGELTPLESPRGLVAVDEYLGDPAASSVIRAAELVPFKAGFEILVQGRVEPAAGRRMQRLGVSLVRDDRPWWRKSLTLFGPRVWRSNVLTGSFPSDPGPLEPIDIRWEHAFGGQSEDGKARFDANPAGHGWAPRQGHKAKGRAVPQIDREPFILSATKRYAPAGLGPIAPHWGARAKAFATLDEVRAQEGGCPYTPATPESLYNCAPTDQQLPETPRAGDRLRLEHWYPDHPAVDLTLPSPALHCVLLGAGKPIRALTPRWDTLLVDTAEQEVHLIFRLGLKEAGLPDNPRLALSESTSRIEDEAAATPTGASA